ncbi:FumA C-terminus/TtdB family hydratase beta subunit [Candidatus Bipolaricaulota bacterium]|nr:FumA C-terminus/TtdB family hydratase beta subunit [Candidatus Bipolaricaulota bacterium]
MEREITLPVAQDLVRELRVGDVLYLTGRFFTARDEAHHLMLERKAKGEEIPFDPSQMALFHCGPVVKEEGTGRPREISPPGAIPWGWRVIAAGPTTSARMEMFEDRFLSAFGVKIIIGKGGMGERTQRALEAHGAVYTHYTGGAGALAAKAIEQVEDVFWLDELGMPEAVWIFRVKSFGPLLVTMDSTGGSLYTELAKTIAKNMVKIRERMKD